MYFTYVIRDRTGLRYTGHTSDLEARLVSHNSGRSRWTKQGSDWKLIHSEVFQTRSEAIIRERWLKSGVGREFINRLLATMDLDTL